MAVANRTSGGNVPMEIIDSIHVQHHGVTRSINLVVGDLAKLPQEHSVDAIIVSAFPDDYAPMPGTLIAALEHRGISVAALAERKTVDLRQFSSCWLSETIDQADAGFRRILCFEPANRGKATEVVGDIFRSIIPFTTGPSPINSIAMPLVATGDQGEDRNEMLRVLVDAAVHWLNTGMPLVRIDIVLHSTADVESLTQTFSTVKTSLKLPASHPNFKFDAFVSYSWDNKVAVDQLVNCFLSSRPNLRLFVDRLELRPGAAWQQHIFESLDDARKVICMLSPSYLKSRICQEEFNMALFRHRESEDGVLLPVFLQSAELPTYMRMTQYLDAREGDDNKISQTSVELLKRI
jgi:hypothetical protein